MTTILHVKDDGIYTDDRWIEPLLDDRVVRIHRAPKAFLSKDKTFIYSITGSLYLKDIDEIENKIKENILDKGYKTVEWFAVEEMNLIVNGLANLLVIAKDGTFLVKKENDIEQVVAMNISHLPYYGMGSGGNIAEGILRVTGNPKEAMDKALMIDTISGSQWQYIPYNVLEELK